jgi:hypothetical protein
MVAPHLSASRFSDSFGSQGCESRRGGASDISLTHVNETGEGGILLTLPTYLSVL